MLLYPGLMAYSDSELTLLLHQGVLHSSFLSNNLFSLFSTVMGALQCKILSVAKSFQWKPTKVILQGSA